MTSDEDRIVQDATVNLCFVDGATGDVLSMREAQRVNESRPADVVLDETGIVTYVGKFGHAGWVDYMDQEQYFRDNYMNAVYAWKKSGAATMQRLESVSDWTVKHTAVFDGAYATALDALADIQNLRLAGATLVGITDALRTDHSAVSGFRIMSDDGQTIIGDFVTVQLQSGEYSSINIDTGEILNGSYDQIMDDLLGSGRGLNPSIDLSHLINPAIFVGFDGKLIVDWSLDESSAAVAEMITERISRSTHNEYLDGRSITVTYDNANAIWSDITSIYQPDGNIASEVVTMDSGAEFRSTYDISNSQVWSVRVDRFTEFGEAAAIKFKYDAGGTLQFDYDLTNLHVWSAKTVRADSLGRIEAYLYQYDAGGRLNVSYDLAGTQIWSSLHSRYNGSNQLEAQSVKYDAGGHFDSIYDVGNNHLWREMYKRVNALNNLEAEVYKFDDGRKANYFYDHNNSEAWQFYVHTYSPEGSLISHKFMMDDGTIV